MENSMWTIEKMKIKRNKNIVDKSSLAQRTTCMLAQRWAYMLAQRWANPLAPTCWPLTLALRRANMLALRRADEQKLHWANAFFMMLGQRARTTVG